MTNDEGDDVEVSFENNGNTFLSLDVSNNGLSLKIDMSSTNAGEYSVQINLATENENNTSSSTHQFQINIQGTNTPPRFDNDISGLLFTRII